MNYTVTVFSKNKVSLKNFFKFFNQELSSIGSYSLILSHRQKKTSRKIVSVLKSPHVNKTAQVHFSSQNFSKQFLIFSHKPNRFFLFMKKIQANLFPDIVVQIKSLVKFNYTHRLNSKFLNPNNFLLDLDTLIKKNQTFDLKNKNLKLVSPIENQILLKTRKKSRSYKALSIKTINYLRVWDCYGEAVLLGFKRNKKENV
uniref:ribosomal protein S10 n=1 Tax=Haslea pseudostrearia TaxID=197756 RepID=UPI002208969F|nr:ribosomal protein S10 [Haslea pseudostrearia]UXN44184.1 ribosomal protein S10 [Haslea pseudostrearia]